MRGTQSCPTLWDPMNYSHQAPLSMGFSRQEYWRGLPYLPPGNLPDSGIEPASLMSPALASGLFSTSATWEARDHHPSPILFFLLAKLRFYTHQIITPHSSLPSLNALGTLVKNHSTVCVRVYFWTLYSIGLYVCLYANTTLLLITVAF